MPYISKSKIHKVNFTRLKRSIRYSRREESVSEISRPTPRRREIELVPMYSSRCTASSRKLSVFSERVVSDSTTQ